MPASTTGHIAATTQQYLEILDITKDILLLKDGSTALVMEVSAINFGLLSEPEQDAIIYAYAALINSLSFPIQIVISSRPKDVSNYLEYIDEQFQQAPSDMRRQQIASYRQFVANLITEQNVLDKNFYAVIPLSAIEVGLMGDSNPILSAARKKDQEFDKNTVIERALNTLLPRKDHMVSQFARFGLQTKQLNTKELIQLFYSLYNSQASEGVKVVDTKDYTTAVIQAQGAAQQPAQQTMQATPMMQPMMAAPAQAPAVQAAPLAAAPMAPAAPAAVQAPALGMQLPVEQAVVQEYVQPVAPAPQVVASAAPTPVGTPAAAAIPAEPALVATPMEPTHSAPTAAPAPAMTAPTGIPAATAIPQESTQFAAPNITSPAAAAALQPSSTNMAQPR